MVIMWQFLYIGVFLVGVLISGAMLLMMETLHDLENQNCMNYGAIVNIGSCRISIINSRAFVIRTTHKKAFQFIETAI